MPKNMLICLFLGGLVMKCSSQKQIESFLQRLAMVTALLAISSQGVAIAQEPPDCFGDGRSEISQSRETTLNMVEELYGASRLSEVADKYHLAGGDPNCPGNVSFIVAGEVRSPGEYNLQAPINLLNVILAAGGPTRAGSMRQIHVYLDGSLVGEFDLYDFFYEGQAVGDYILNGGEQVVVMPHGALVSVSGNVMSPAVFELKPEEENLQKLFDLCGGFAGDEDSYRIEVVRVIAAMRKTVFSAYMKKGKKIPSFKLEAGDRVSVFETPAGVEGRAWVQFPDSSMRAFSLNKIERVSHLLKELQPLSDKIATSYAELLREGRPDKKYEVVGISLSVLSQMIAAGDYSHDLILRPGDRLMLFDRDFIEKKPVVGIEISGQLPIFTDYKPGMKISDLLQIMDVELPGGSEYARMIRRSLHGVQLESASFQIELSAASRGSQRHNVLLQPFDVLVIQPKTD
jgi:protein involved in polysaccharide export with SLBB domain